MKEIKPKGQAPRPTRGKTRVDEAYNVQTRPFEIRSEVISEPTIKAHDELFNGYVEGLNRLSAKLDGADREDVNPNDSQFRTLKANECYLINGAFLHALYFENIGDLQSTIAMDTLAYMRLQRDWGTFNDWQEDFVATGLAARNGWVVTVFNAFLNRFINVMIDSHDVGMPLGSYPVIVIDCWEHAYAPDFQNKRKDYLYGVMRELNWEVIEDRFKKVERLIKALKE